MCVTRAPGVTDPANASHPGCLADMEPQYHPGTSRRWRIESESPRPHDSRVGPVACTGIAGSANVDLRPRRRSAAYVEEDVATAVEIGRGQVRCVGTEHHEASVGRHLS